MKRNSVILLVIASVVFFLANFTAEAQYQIIPTAQIPTKIKELTDGNLKDSLLWATAGFFLERKISLAELTTNIIYVSNKGLYYNLEFIDTLGNISASSVYFMPFFRIIVPENPDANFMWAPNEHICVCSAKLGAGVIEKQGNKFACVGAKLEYDDIEGNIGVDCFDTEAIDIYFTKFYELGIKLKGKMKITPFIIKELE